MEATDFACFAQTLLVSARTLDSERDNPRGPIFISEAATNFARLVCEARTSTPRQCRCRGAD